MQSASSESPDVLLFGHAAAARPLADTDNDKLGGLDRIDTDLAVEPPQINHLLRVGLTIALDIEGFLRSLPEQFALFPLRIEEGGDVAADTAPEVVVVRLKDDPL